jgi:AcrR family transcriptional regulator
MADKERKQQIIRAALKRFVKHGLNKTTLDEIARDLRIGKATLYHYFTSKEDLYNQTLRFEITQYFTDLMMIFSDKETDLKAKFNEFIILKENLQDRYKLIYDLLVHTLTSSEFEEEKIIFKELNQKEREFFRQIISSEFPKQDKITEEIADFISWQGWYMAFNDKFKKDNNLLSGSKELLLKLFTAF